MSIKEKEDRQSQQIGLRKPSSGAPFIKILKEENYVCTTLRY
jgi:hypothetical protein